MTEATSSAPLLTTPLDALHRELGARMVPFAGYSMPVQYPTGILTEHTWCRSHASLFDVSHMGQAWLRGPDVASALETIVPASYKELRAGRTRYTVLTNEQGGILDDLMITHVGPDTWFMVVNAACKDADFAHIQAAIGDRVEMEIIPDRALIALQGPEAAAAMAHLAPATESMVFMDAGPVTVAGIPCFVTRSGYTGEDGFEISVPADQADSLARQFLAMESVQPCGLGARDSLRLEAGLPLYGSDIDTTTTPVEGNLTFAIGKRRRSEGGFPGADLILRQLADGVSRLRVGIALDGRAPARAHSEIQSVDGVHIGEVTSGGFAPTLEAPIAMGYVDIAYAEPGTPLHLMVRGKALEGRVVSMPFVEQRYYRG